MNNEEEKIGIWSEIGILLGIAAFAVCGSLAPTPVLARQMQCSYDYTTHVTTLQLEDLGAPDGSISYNYAHSISPTGGEGMFPFKESDPALLRGTGQLKFIAEKLFHEPLAEPSSIEFVDFDWPTFKELQFPAAHFERSVDTISAPLVVWSCHRTD